MTTFNYVIGRTNAYRNVEFGIDIPSLWTATVISGLPNGKTINSGSAATEKEAALFLSKKMREAGYSGTLKRVDDVTVKFVAPVAKLKKLRAAAKAMRVEQSNWTKADIQQAVVTTQKTAKASETVTFNCWLDTSRETIKAYKIDEKSKFSYVGKSISVFVPKGKVAKRFDDQFRTMITLQYGTLTIPAWLYAKL
jgi:hypothetical protein